MREKLEDYEKICPFCGGSGNCIVLFEEHVKCELCNGKGKIDWIKQIKKSKIIKFYSHGWF